MSAFVAAVALPLVVGAVLLTAGRLGVGAAAWTGAATSALSGVLVVLAWVVRAPGSYAGEVDLDWVSTLGARWHLGVDGVSLPFCLLTAVLGAVACVAVALDPPGERPPAPLVGLLLVVVGAAQGVFGALDLLVFFVFFELALLPTWFVIAWWGDPSDEAGRRRAATRFLMFTVTGSALLLAGFITVARRTGTLQVTDLVVARVLVEGPVGAFAALVIVLGLAVKVPVWPLHTWLPDAHAKAPTAGSVLLAGVLLKLGTYGLLRVWIAIVPESAASIAPWLGAFGVVGIVWSALACLRQSDLKRLVAYSSVGHMGFVVLGAATMGSVGVTAVVVGSVAHGLVSALLFVLAGTMRRRWGTTRIDGVGRGLYVRTPVLAWSFAFAAVASLGLPGLAVFWGELLALRAAYEVGPVLDRPLAWTLLGVAAVGVVLTSAYVVVLLRRLLQGVPTPTEHDVDLARGERAVVATLAALVVVLGLAPGVVVAVVQPDLFAVVGGVR